MAIKSESSLGWSVLPVMIWKPLIRWQKEMEEISVFYFVFAGIVMRSFYARKKKAANYNAWSLIFQRDGKNDPWQWGLSCFVAGGHWVSCWTWDWVTVQPLKALQATWRKKIDSVLQSNIKSLNTYHNLALKIHRTEIEIISREKSDKYYHVDLLTCDCSQ